MTVGERIRHTRVQKGLTQKELAAKLDVTQQGIMQWENGTRNPKPDTLRRLAEALDISYWKLAEDSNDPYNITPIVQDPGFVANMILNDVTALEVSSRNNGKQITPIQHDDLIHDLVLRRSEQFRIPSNTLLYEIEAQTNCNEALNLDKNDFILKEILQTLNEMNLDGWIAVLHHIRELSKISDYQNEH